MDRNMEDGWWDVQRRSHKNSWHSFASVSNLMKFDHSLLPIRLILDQSSCSPSAANTKAVCLSHFVIGMTA